jgi:diguanylate cyclase (GGDEF)-like protein
MVAGVARPRTVRNVTEPQCVHTGVMTKQALATMCHTIEQSALALGGNVIGLFQYSVNYERRSDHWNQLAASCDTVIAGHADEFGRTDDVEHIAFGKSNPAENHWTLIWVHRDAVLYVNATDRNETDAVGVTVESGRLFDAEIGSDPQRAHDIIVELGAMLGRPASFDKVAAAAEQAVVSPVAQAMSAGIVQLARRLDHSVKLRTVAQHDAHNDSLTGLLNRAGLRHWLGDTDAHMMSMPPVGAVMIDLDGFKPINDTYGHDQGDVALRNVADVIRREVGEQGIAARWGGDEFVVMCPGSGLVALEAIANAIVERIGNISVGGLQLGASAGLQMCRQRPLDLSAADEAMYSAKRSGGRCVAHATEHRKRASPSTAPARA